MKKNTSGFTIVELLIVVVVIAILAAVSVVAYSGIQQRARNTQTVSAVAAYVKALRSYKVDTGQYPAVSSCLGVGYENSRCDTRGGTFVENSGGFNTTYLSTYFDSSVPTPATNFGQYDPTFQLAGAWYAWNSGLYGGANNGGFGLYHQGGLTCPEVGGLTLRSSTPYTDGSGAWCRYSMD